jgi:hypothetical protein
MSVCAYARMRVSVYERAWRVWGVLGCASGVLARNSPPRAATTEDTHRPPRYTAPTIGNRASSHRTDRCAHDRGVASPRRAEPATSCTRVRWRQTCTIQARLSNRSKSELAKLTFSSRAKALFCRSHFVRTGKVSRGCFSLRTNSAPHTAGSLLFARTAQS